jgi:excisionase family DNA binding protein
MSKPTQENTPRGEFAGGDGSTPTEIADQVLAYLLERLPDPTPVGALNYEDAARYLGGLSVEMVRQLKESGEIGYAKIGRRTVFPIESLDDFLKRKTTAPWWWERVKRRAPQDGLSGRR